MNAFLHMSSPIPLGQVFTLSAAGQRELQGIVTTLSAPELELLVRQDATLTLGQIRAAMPGLPDEAFGKAYRTLQRRGMLEEATQDQFDLLSKNQLQMLGIARTDTSGVSLRRNGFTVGLALRREASRPRKPGELLRAVVVEDDPLLARFIQSFLAFDGFHVQLAATRAEVIAELSRPELPDVVLLDVNLPDADGFDILGRMRQHGRLRHVPVIMLTACATREAVLQALAAGADGYLTKPFMADAMVRAVRAVAGLPAAEGESSAGNDLWINRDALPLRQRQAA